MTALVHISDLHINSTVALCTPTYHKDDGGTGRYSAAQRWIWHNWLDFLDKVEEAKKHDKVILVINGEVVDGDKKNRSNQICCRNEADYKQLAAEVLDPLVKMVDLVYVTRGTEAHTGKSAYLDEEMAKDFEAERDPATGNYSWWTLPLKVDGVTFDISHHVSMGQLPWTEKNAAMKLAVVTMMRYMEHGDKPPDLALRGHVHRWSDSYDAFPTRGIIGPAWTLKNSYIYRLGSSAKLSEIGGFIVHTSAGHYEVQKIKYTPKRRKWITPPLK